ncbi:MAG: GlxA family transcriptional regulator, partial [Alcaligenaceae bacterium]|nr:GlxA family transcriptional regulator [Alcaligenaceae bacterium]
MSNLNTEPVAGRRKTKRPRCYGFLLVPNFTLIGFASATEPLRMANMACRDARPYHWVTISGDGGPICASNGVIVQPDNSIATAPQLDALFVCGSNPVPHHIESIHLDWLRGLAHKGTALGGICTGSYWLARAGLLNGYRCTLHWEDADRFLADFRHIVVSTRIFEIDRDRYTCSGGIAPVDMMIGLIGLQPGDKDLAAAVAELMVCERIRSSGDAQRIPLRQRIGTGQPKLIEAVSLMESNLEEPLRADEIAHYVDVSPRQLERLFQEHLKCTPGAYYLELRLLRARQMLLGTEDAI